MTGTPPLSFLRHTPSKRDHLRDYNASPFPFISSQNEQLVWKWDQVKLCGRMLNVVLPSTRFPPGCPRNVPDVHEEFVKFTKGQVIVQSAAYLERLEANGYHIGICAGAQAASSIIILLGLHGPCRHSKLKRFSRHIGAYITNLLPGLTLQSSLPFHYCWATEFWVSDSVIVNCRPVEPSLLSCKASQPHARDGSMMLCVGLPMTSFGPLFNTLVSTLNVAAARLEAQAGFIWIDAAVDPSNFTIEWESPTEPVQDGLLKMLDQIKRCSWLVKAKLTVKLDRSSEAATVILTELHEISQIRVTSTHKPVTHS